MSVIIRLQNLPWTANARDIRNFFAGLSIPEGGVHIIGGEMGDAFIAFSTDEDARCAMLKDREKLMEIQVRLLLSSRAEMQKVIETARKVATTAAPIAVPVPIPVAPTRPAPAGGTAPLPPIIGGLGGFLGQVKAAVPVGASGGAPSFLTYQQQAGITLSEVTGRSRSRSSSSDDSDREREWERERERERERDHRDQGRKRRTDRRDSQERELKLAHTGGAVGPSPWAQAPPQVQLTTALDLGLSLAAVPIMPSLQSYTTSTSSTTNNITNNYNLASNASANPQLMAALQQVANSSQAQVMEQPAKSSEPIAFASVNPYAQMYPQLFQQQQLLLQQQQTPAKVSPLGMGSSPSGSGGTGTGIGGGNTPVAVADTCYIRISGMCPTISYSDIRKYFQGLYIPHNGIKIMTVNGNRTGVAYVEFSRVSSAQKAVQRNNTMFRDRMIQIAPVGDDEFERAEERANQQRNHHDGGGRNHHHNGGGERNSDRGEGGMPTPIPVTTVLYIEDLPQLTTEQEIMKMFSSNYTVVDIQLSPSPNNRRECVAFVLFARDSDAKSALEDTSSHYIGFRQLRVKPSTLQEMQNAKEKLRRANEQLLKEEADQREELLQDQQRRQQQDQENQSRFGSDPRRRQTEELQQQQQQQQMSMSPSMMSPFANGNMPFNMPPLQQQHLPNGGNFPFSMSNNMAMNMNCNGNSNGNGPNFANNCPERSENGGVNTQRPRQEDVFVRVHNCEYATRANDLGELFSLEQLRIEHIEQLFNDRNQSSGEFIVEFSDPASTKQAVREFHNRRFRGRGLRVVTITPQEIADRMNKPFMDYLPGGNGPRQQQQAEGNNVTASGGGSGNGGRGGGSNEGQKKQQSRRRGPSRFNDISSPPQDQPPQQQLEKPRSQDREKSQESNGSSTASTTTTVKQHFNPFARPDPPLISSTSSLSPSAVPAAATPVIMTEISDKFNRPGCVVAMRNVPFKAELKDILRFFGDYKLSPDDIIRRFNDDGKPTGDTRVAFESPAEARSAFESRRRKQIFNRTVYLDII
ncbi:uncharacterized protein LOC110178730 [Drosophila serrata]|uniref:uncharacterized protein LOC110178730 n=1 Tax=Drosophila serrata TaxID=7274 RepID=UPI000A1D0BFF|nr:uncharacterized protein LOC110178730 [Drosophila serrata]XP_020801612.1 uncharacterized protein LOC110178730 [Drosophila serrata]